MDKVGEYTLKIMKKAKWYNLWLLSFFSKYLKGDILEVGAGIGNFSGVLKTYGDVTAIDISKKYLNEYKTTGIMCGYGDIEKGRYFFRQKQFDSIVCLNVIEHIENDRKAFENIYKLLKHNGVSIVLVPAHRILFSRYDKLLGHYRRYNISQLRETIKDLGFQTVGIRYINWWGAIGWFIYMKFFKRVDFPEKELGIFDIIGKYLLWPEKIMKLPFGLSILLIVKK
jgi:SAM-dependent methyltransferase